MILHSGIFHLVVDHPGFSQAKGRLGDIVFPGTPTHPPATAAIWGITTLSTNNWAYLGGFLGCFSIFFFMRLDAFARLRNRELI